MGNDEIVTPRHEFLIDRAWRHVGDLARYTWVWYTGTIHNLHLRTEDMDEHSYTLANGCIVHNFNPT
jgi:hypothetical protein